MAGYVGQGPVKLALMFVGAAEAAAGQDLFSLVAGRVGALAGFDGQGPDGLALALVGTAKAGVGPKLLCLVARRVGAMASYVGLGQVGPALSLVGAMEAVVGRDGGWDGCGGGGCGEGNRGGAGVSLPRLTMARGASELSGTLDVLSAFELRAGPVH